MADDQRLMMQVVTPAVIPVKTGKAEFVTPAKAGVQIPADGCPLSRA